MIKIKHTPGPWRSEIFGLDGWIIDDFGNYLLQVVESDEEDKYEQDEERRDGNLKIAGMSLELAKALKELSDMVGKTEYAFYPEQQKAENLLKELY